MYTLVEGNVAIQAYPPFFIFRENLLSRLDHRDYRKAPPFSEKFYLKRPIPGLYKMPHPRAI